jgi:hypothetical protein
MGNAMAAASRILFALCCAILAQASPLLAWSPKSQVSIAEEASRLAPFDLRRQIDKHREQLRQGALGPFSGTSPAMHVKNPDGSGELDRVILKATSDAVDAIRAHRPFRETVYQLGVLAHYVADANNPLNTSGADSQEGRYFADFLRYAERVEPRFALVFYGSEPQLESRRSLLFLLDRTIRRGRELYPLIGLEYRRIGFASGLRHFDDRSTAFGVAALSFSHAVSDITRIFRYVWLASGGDDAGSPARRVWPALVLLPRSPRSAPSR